MIIKVKPMPGYRFAQNARVDCIGVHIRAGGIPVGKVIGYEIVNRELILDVKMDVVTSPDDIDHFEYHLRNGLD